jgi:hypothetical protein
LHRYLYAYANPLSFVDLNGYKNVPLFTDADIDRYDRAAKSSPTLKHKVTVHAKDVKPHLRNTVMVRHPRTGKVVHIDAWWSDRRVIEENKIDLARPKPGLQEMIAPLEAGIEPVAAALRELDDYYLRGRHEFRRQLEAQRSKTTMFLAGVGKFAIDTVSQTSMSMWRAYNREGGGLSGYYASAMEINPSYHALIAAAEAQESTGSTAEAVTAFANTFNPIDQGARAGIEMYYAFDRGDYEAAGEQAVPLFGAVMSTVSLAKLKVGPGLPESNFAGRFINKAGLARQEILGVLDSGNSFSKGLAADIRMGQVKLRFKQHPNALGLYDPIKHPNVLDINYRLQLRNYTGVPGSDSMIRAAITTVHEGRHWVDDVSGALWNQAPIASEYAAFGEQIGFAQSIGKTHLDYIAKYFQKHGAAATQQRIYKMYKTIYNLP